MESFNTDPKSFAGAIEPMHVDNLAVVQSLSKCELRNTGYPLYT